MRRNRASRPLTAGEIALGRQIFGDALRCAEARVYRRRYWTFQPRGTAMAPDGNIYFHPADHVHDFSASDTAGKSWFIHELTHVWQHQRGVRVAWCGLFNRNYRYAPLAPGKPFSAYGIEQQASIVADYYRVKNGYRPRQGSHTAADYESLLAGLLAQGLHTSDGRDDSQARTRNMGSRKQKVTDGTRDAKDRIVEKAALVRRSLRDTARSSAERLGEAGEHVQGQVRSAAREADRYARAHPLVLIGITVAVGAILIDLLRSRR